MTPGLHRALALLATIAVVSSVAWGFFVAGSPDTRRQERMDDRRLDALQGIQREIQGLVVDPDVPGELRAALPASLDELAERARMRRIERYDPDTGERYEYRVLSETTYELCATFALARDAPRAVFWNHRSGRQCYTIDVLNPPR